MRTKENVSIPSTSPVLNSSHAVHRAAYNKHVNLNQPKFITKTTTATSRYGTSVNSHHNHGGAISQGRNTPHGYVGASGGPITPSNRMGGESVASGGGTQDHCFRMVPQATNMASTKNGTQASLLATSQANAATTHRSTSRDNVQIGANHYHQGPYSRKSTVGTSKATMAN